MMKNFTLVLCMLAISSLSFAQDCPVINATAVNSNGPGTYAITVNYSADPGINHINMVSFCATNPLTSLFTTECIEVNGSGTTVVNVSCTSTPVVILVPAPGACGTGFPCGLPTFVFGPVGGPLPIKMNSFFATRIGTQVNLSWNTEVEINAKEFVVERKTNGDFQPVATVTATNITEGSKYTFSDRNMEAGVSQYRIKMIDLDGTYRYSEIRAVKGSGTKADFTVFPNPSYGEANVNITDVSENTEIHVYDNSGRLVRKISMNNKNTVSIDNLQKGMYMIRLVDMKTGEAVTKKLSVLN